LAVSPAYTSVKNAFRPLGTIRKKISFVKNYRECAICAILREKTPFYWHTQRLKKVFREVRCGQKAPQRPKKNSIPSGLSEKMFIV